MMKTHTLQIWVEALSGMLIWLAHFGVSYATASIELQFQGALTAPARWALIAFSAGLLALALRLALKPVKDPSDLPGRLRVGTCVLALPAIILQTMPIVLG